MTHKYMDPTALQLFARAYNPENITINARAINDTQPSTTSQTAFDSFQLPKDWTVGYLIEEGFSSTQNGGKLAISFDNFSTTLSYAYNELFTLLSGARRITILLRANTDVYCYRYTFAVGTAATGAVFNYYFCKAPLTDNKIYFRRTTSYTFPTTYIIRGFFS